MNAQYVKKLPSNEQLRLVGILSSDDLTMLRSNSANTNTFHLNTQFWRLAPEWRKTMGTSSVDVMVGYGVNNILIDVGTSHAKLDTNQLSVRGEYGFELAPVWKTSLGLDVNAIDAKVDLNTSGASSNARIFTESLNLGIYGLFWTNDFKPSTDSRWTYSPELRADRFSATKQSLLGPRFSAKYELNQTTNLKFLSGQYYQQPQLQELNANLGNPELKVESAQHIGIGVDKTFSKNEGLDMSSSALLFYKKIGNFVNSSTAFVVRDNQLVIENYNNQGEGYVQGIELSGKLKEISWGLTLNYSFSQSYLRKPGENYYPSPYDQTHAVALLASYKTAVWEFGARLRYVTGNPYTPIVDGYYNDTTGNYIPKYGGLFSARRPEFFQIDVRADRKWVYDTWIMSLYFDIQNITNTKNVESISYSYDFSQSANTTGLPILPTFGVKGEF